MPSEAFGLHRAGVEALVHIEGLTQSPANHAELLISYVRSTNNGVVPADAQAFFDPFKTNPVDMLATLYVHWAQRQMQKAANDAAQSGLKQFRGVNEAPEIARQIENDGIQHLGTTLWRIVKDARHWHPLGYGRGGAATKDVFDKLGIPLAYLVPYRFASRNLHAADVSDYLEPNLQMPPPRWEPGLVATAQHLLCRTTSIVDKQYSIGKAFRIEAFADEGMRLRATLFA